MDKGGNALPWAGGEIQQKGPCVACKSGAGHCESEELMQVWMTKTPGKWEELHTSHGTSVPNLYTICRAHVEDLKDTKDKAESGSQWCAGELETGWMHAVLEKLRVSAHSCTMPHPIPPCIPLCNTSWCSTTPLLGSHSHLILLHTHTHTHIHSPFTGPVGRAEGWCGSGGQGTWAPTPASPLLTYHTRPGSCTQAYHQPIPTTHKYTS